MERASFTARRMLAAVLLTSGCGAPGPEISQSKNAPETTAASRTSDSSKIIGKNDLVPVLNDGADLPAELRPTIDAYDMISPMGCTATHIGNGIVLTAGHCFKAPIERANDRACPVGVSVAWGVRQDKEAYLTSSCEVILAEQQSDEIDYAIFKVSPVPPVSVDVDLSARPANGRRITIFGFPQMRPLEWSQYCTVAPGTNGNWGDNQFSHQCDTEPGNSGSSVIDATSAKVVGIHDGGLVPWNYATYLTDTPLAEIIGGGGTTGGTDGGTTGGTPDEVPDQEWGPFGDELDQTLIVLGDGYDGLVSFYLTFDVETSYDYVYVTDGSGRMRIYTGNGARRFIGSAGLVAPVTIRFKSDWAVHSTSVGISQVTFQ